jgi:AcrR family transcriptional regulator
MVRKITRARCSICSHIERARIELARVSGVSLDNIAESFGVKRSSIWRHMTSHVSDADRAVYLADVDLKQLAERANAESLSLIDYLAIVRSTLLQQMQMAAGLNDRSGTAALAGRLNETLKLLASLTGELLRLNPHTVNHNVTVFMSSPLYVELEQMLIATLSDHPDALAKVVDGLRRLEERAPAPEYAAAAALASPVLREINHA